MANVTKQEYSSKSSILALWSQIHEYYQLKMNLTTSLSSSSTNVQYPSAKAVWDTMLPRSGGAVNGNVYPTRNDGTSSTYTLGISDNIWANVYTKAVTAQNGLICNYGTNFDINYHNTTKFRVDSNGNVGIGVTSMTDKLHVNGNTRIVGTTNCQSIIPISNVTYSLGDSTHAFSALHCASIIIGNRAQNTNNQLKIKNASDTDAYGVMEMNSSNTLTIGYGSASNGCNTAIDGASNLDLRIGTSSRVTIARVDANGMTCYGGVSAMGICDLTTM